MTGGGGCARGPLPIHALSSAGRGRRCHGVSASGRSASFSARPWPTIRSSPRLSPRCGAVSPQATPLARVAAARCAVAAPSATGLRLCAGGASCDPLSLGWARDPSVIHAASPRPIACDSFARGAVGRRPLPPDACFPGRPMAAAPHAYLIQTRLVQASCSCAGGRLRPTSRLHAVSPVKPISPRFRRAYGVPPRPPIALPAQPVPDRPAPSPSLCPPAIRRAEAAAYRLISIPSAIWSRGSAGLAEAQRSRVPRDPARRSVRVIYGRALRDRSRAAMWLSSASPS